MKKTQFIDTIRNIKKEIISYLSIMIIALLAVASFLGINFAATALRDCADSFYRQRNFRDLEITSTMLMSEEDIKAFENTEGVEAVEGVYYISGKVEQTDQKVSVGVSSITEKVNTVTLLDGRMPQAETECVLEQELIRILGVSVGDTIKVTDSRGQLLSYLKGTEFTITGVVLHPDHYARRAYVPGDRYVLVNKEAFDIEKLEGAFMKAEIKVAGSEKYSLFSKKYDALVNSVKEKIEPLNDELAKSREVSVRSSMQKKIDEGEQKLADARVKLDDGRKELDENTQKYEDGVKEIESAKNKLEDGKKQLDDGKKQLEDLAAQLEEGRAKLADAKSQLDYGKEQLDNGAAQLKAGKELLDAGRIALEDARNQINEANTQLTDAYNEAEGVKADIRNLLIDAIEAVVGSGKTSSINWAQPHYVADATDPDLSIGTFDILTNLSIDLTITIRERVEYAVSTVLKLIDEEDKYDEVIAEIESNDGFNWINNKYNSIADKLNQWESGHEQFIAGRNAYFEKESEYEAKLAEYNSGLELYNYGLNEYNSKKALYDQGLAEYNAGLAKYNEGQTLLTEKTEEYNKGLAEYQDGLKKLEDGKKQLEEGEQKYEDGEKEYENGVQELNDGRKRLEDLSSCYFVTVDKTGNVGFVHADSASDNISSVGITFALVFILVGALVIYVTIGRIIGEQRTLIGAQKALGFFSREVLMKYLLYGTSSTFIGMILGTVIGFTIIQSIITRAYGAFYIVKGIPNAFNITLFGMVIIAGIILSALAVVWACLSLLRQTARELMQPEMPKGKNKSVDSSKTGGSLYSRMIFRNIITDWRRVLITTISIAGCCALLMIGFHMRYSINKSIDSQFNVIMKYQQEITFESEISADAEENIKAALLKNGISSDGLMSRNFAYDSKGRKLVAHMYCSDPESIRKGFLLKAAGEKRDVEFNDQGIVITQQMAKEGGFKRGDTITIYDSEMNPHQAQIIDMYENYLGRNIYLNRAAYKNIFGKEPVDNVLWLAADKDKAALNDILKGIKGFNSVSVKSDVQRTFSSLAKVLTIITLVLIVAAGMMAYFVLLNLVNMYLDKKKRELVVMRINGFTTNEVLRYVSLESVVTTVAGIILGLIIGTALGNFIVITMETGDGATRFFHGISVSSLLFSTLITLLFSAVINAIALRKVKHLKLNDM